MKKIYFAGKFNMLPNEIVLADRLKNDYRSILLGSSKKLTFACENAILSNYPILYKGPFYCEQASNGDYTSNDCEVVVDSEINALDKIDIFCLVLDENFSVGSVVELIEAAHKKKRVVVFYKNESSNYSIKSEYWFAITRAIKICRENNTIMEVFSYDSDFLPLLYNWLNNLVYNKRFVCTRENILNIYLEKCILLNTYKYINKTIYHYNDNQNTFIIEKYDNGLIIVKTNNILNIKGLIDVTNNNLYTDEKINEVFFTNVIIEGTDSVGKTSTITNLIEQGIVCIDRSEVICKYMLFNVSMKDRVEAYQEYLKGILPGFVIFLTNSSSMDIEKRINDREVLSEFDRDAVKYNELYVATYNELKNRDCNSPIELIECMGLSLDAQVEEVKKCIMGRLNNE